MVCCEVCPQGGKRQLLLGLSQRSLDGLLRSLPPRRKTTIIAGIVTKKSGWFVAKFAPKEENDNYCWDCHKEVWMVCCEVCHQGGKRQLLLGLSQRRQDGLLRSLPPRRKTTIIAGIVTKKAGWFVAKFA